MAFAPQLLVLSLLVYFSSAALPTATVSVVSPQGPYYPGDQVTLRCDIAEYTDWYHYYWYSGHQYIQQQNSRTINTALPDQPGQYQFTCEGRRSGSPSQSQHSKPTPVTVAAMPEPTVEISMATVYPGEPVTLTCLIQPSGGWTYGWRYNPWSSHNLQSRSESDSNTYTIDSATWSDEGDYACGGRRKGSGKLTSYSKTAYLTVQALPTPTLAVKPEGPVFTGETVTMTCEIESFSGWTYKWYKEPSRDPVSEGNTFTITSAAESDEGQYWCQGERRDRPTTSYKSRGITLDVKANVILESPVHPVMEGDPLTLHCRYLDQPSNISADFYKDGTLLHTSSTGDMTIPAVSKSHEGLYKCSNTERGESPESWIAVKSTTTGSRSLIMLLAGVGAVISVIILASVLFCVYRSKYGTGGCLRASDTDHQPQQQSTNQNSPQGQRTNQNSAQDQRSNQNPASDSVYMPLQNRTADTYETITPLYMPLQRGASDVYETIKPPRHGDEDDNEDYDDVTSPV